MCSINCNGACNECIEHDDEFFDKWMVPVDMSTKEQPELGACDDERQINGVEQSDC